MHSDDNEIICPFCEQGLLIKKNCKKCKNEYLICDECESIFKNAKSLNEEFDSSCPNCGVPVRK